MGIILDRQAEVTRFLDARLIENVLARAEELHYRQRKIGEVIRISGPPLQHEIVERDRVGVGGQIFPELLRQLYDALPPLGAAHDSPDRGDVMRLQKSRHRAVGGDHEILDHVGGGVLLGSLDRRDFAIVAHCSGLDCLDLQRAVVEAIPPQGSSDGALEPQLRLQHGSTRNFLRDRSVGVYPVADA